MIKQDIVCRLLVKLNKQHLDFSDIEHGDAVIGLKEDNQKVVDQFLFDELFGIKLLDSDYLNEKLMQLDYKQQDLYNEYITWLYGYGKDKIYLNDGSQSDANSLRLNSIHQYDKANFAYQQESIKTEFPQFYKEKPYRLFMYPTWVRLIIDNKLKYATFMSLSRYVADRVDIECQDLIFELLPYKRVKGERHGERNGDLIRYDIRYDANGFESQLTKLKEKANNYLLDLIDVLDEEFHHIEKPFVFITDAQYQPSSIHVVFSNEAAIKDLHWETFMDDVSKIKTTDESIIQNIVDSKVQQMIEFIKNSYSEIMGNK